MGSSRSVVWVSCLLLSAQGFLGAGESAQDLLQRAADRLAKLKSYTCAVKTMITHPGESYEATGKFFFVAPDQMRVESKSALKNDAGSIASESLIVSDGKLLWIASKTDKGQVVTRLDLTKVKAAITDDAFASLHLPTQGIRGQLDLGIKLYDFSVGKEETASGQPASLLTGTVKKSLPADLKDLGDSLGNTTPKLNLLIGKTDPLICSFVSLDKDGKEVEHVDYSDYKLDAAIDAKLFSYAPPKEAQVSDVTDNILQQLPKKAPEKKEEPKKEK